MQEVRACSHVFHLPVHACTSTAALNSKLVWSAQSCNREATTETRSEGHVWGAQARPLQGETCAGVVGGRSGVVSEGECLIKYANVCTVVHFEQNFLHRLELKD